MRDRLIREWAYMTSKSDMEFYDRCLRSVQETPSTNLSHEGERRHKRLGRLPLRSRSRGRARAVSERGRHQRSQGARPRNDAAKE